eukprot:g23363.t1
MDVMINALDRQGSQVVLRCICWLWIFADLHPANDVRQEKSGELLGQLQDFVKQQFGGPLCLVPEGEHQTREGLTRLWQVRGFKASEESGSCGTLRLVRACGAPGCPGSSFSLQRSPQKTQRDLSIDVYIVQEEVRSLLGFLDFDGPGVAGEDLTFLEADFTQRRLMAQKLRQKRQEQQQEILAKAFSEEQFFARAGVSHHLRLPASGDLRCAFNTPLGDSALACFVFREAPSRAEPAPASLEAAAAAAKPTCQGASERNVVRAWRMKLDPENRSSLDEAALRRYCSKAGVQLDDRDGLMRLEVLCPESAEVLAQFRKWARDLSGSCAELWDTPELQEARRTPQREGRWRSEKKMLLGHLSAVLKSNYCRSVPALLLSSLDAYGCGFVSREDFVWLDHWQPTEWITANPDAEEFAILKALLVRPSIESLAEASGPRRLEQRLLERVPALLRGAEFPRQCRGCLEAYR